MEVTATNCYAFIFSFISKWNLLMHDSLLSQFKSSSTSAKIRFLENKNCELNGVLNIMIQSSTATQHEEL